LYPWIAAIGIWLQMVGTVGAVLGLTSTYRQIFARHSLWRDFGRSFLVWFRHSVLRRPRDITIHPLTAHARMQLDVQAFGRTRPGPPGPNACVEERLDFLSAYVEKIDDELVETRRQAQGALRDATLELRAADEELRSRIREATSEVTGLQNALTGVDGFGLQQTAAGLAMSIVGMVLTVFGLSFG
jgi:hypothetical protein